MAAFFVKNRQLTKLRRLQKIYSLIRVHPWLKLFLIQNFREVNRFEFAALAREQTLQVHQAA